MPSSATIQALLVLCLLAPAPISANEEPEETPPVSLSELASAADAVVLAQARDTDYIYRREFPVRGTAYLRVLIPYKLAGSMDLIEVYEEGLHPNECYFPNPTVFEEGRRYLLFLRADPDKAGRFRGMPQGCALDVLVDESNRYAVRVPVTGVGLTGDLESLARPMTFVDEYALEDEESLSPEDRDRWLEAGWIAPAGDGYRYTHGVGLSEVRGLIDPAALEEDRAKRANR